MSAAPGTFEDRRDRAPEHTEQEEGESSFWAWFALGVLLFCWIAEATMCAERGF